MCAFPGDGRFSWGNSSLLLATDCPVPPQNFYLKHSGHLGVKGKPWSRCFGVAGRSLPLMATASAEKNQAKVSEGPTLAGFLIYMSVDQSNRIMRLKKDYLAGSCLPNISPEQVFTAEIQRPDSNVYGRNSASYLTPATHCPLSP